MDYPCLLVSDPEGNIFDLEGIQAAGRSGKDVFPLQAGLIEIPGGSQIFFLPDRKAGGYSPKNKEWLTFDDAFAVAAYISPGYIHTAFPLFEKKPDARQLPFFSYSAVGFKKGKYYVPAIRMDKDPKHQPECFDNRLIEKQIIRKLKKYPGNRLVAHFAEHCVRQFGCPNAKNYFLGRWEAPVAVSPVCNADCIGCISEQNGKNTPAPQYRLDFTPTVAEIVEMAVPHLNEADKPIVSFGQGCEGEPLLKAELIREAIRSIRKQTSKGVIHMNTNGSLPQKIGELFEAGLDSIRVSINSARADHYKRYFRPARYSFDDVVESLMIAGKMKKFSSVNYFVFPGYTDSGEEHQAFCRLLKKTGIPYIQWRNLNIDPDYYAETMNLDFSEPALGMKQFIRTIRSEFPGISMGCTNPSRADMKRILRKAGYP